MPTLTRSCDQQPLRETVLPAPTTTVGSLLAGRPPGPDGSNLINIGSNRGLTRENWSLQVDTPVMLRRHDHLKVFTFVLPTPDTNAGALPSGPPPDPDGSNVTDLTSNHGPTRENEPLQMNTPAQRRDAPLVRRKRRRLASAKEQVDAHIRFPDVNDGQLYYSLQLVLRKSYRSDLMTLLFSFLGTFVVVIVRGIKHVAYTHLHLRSAFAAIASLLMHLFLSVLGFDPCPSGAWFVFLACCCPGYSAGRGASPAGGAPGGG
ncbi:hypothetical protein F511_26873 [Dorcoceras hygrometricum]|uniref:Uncharacterized protein n=1 Tax=Dorcoceras hygrometricum TaxID=472368 RepID=A0A2Z7DE56_9LAMI|nr:hypothetical protein F511_26873 [Dorcoceras hygrometricum]